MEAAPDASRVEARIELTQADVLRGLQGMPERRFGAVTVYVMAGLMLLGAGVLKGFDLPILLTVGFCLVLLVGTNLFSTRRLARLYFEDMPSDRREITYVFTPVAMEITTQHAHSRHDYAAVKRYVITAHTLLLYVSGSIAQIVPLRAFAAPDRERVIGWLNAQVKPAPRVPVTLLRSLRLWGVLIVAFVLIWWLLNP